MKSSNKNNESEVLFDKISAEFENWNPDLPEDIWDKIADSLVIEKVWNKLEDNLIIEKAWQDLNAELIPFSNKLSFKHIFVLLFVFIFSVFKTNDSFVKESTFEVATKQNQSLSSSLDSKENTIREDEKHQVQRKVVKQNWKNRQTKISEIVYITDSNSNGLIKSKENDHVFTQVNELRFNKLNSMDQQFQQTVLPLELTIPAKKNTNVRFGFKAELNLSNIKDRNNNVLESSHVHLGSAYSLLFDYKIKNHVIKNEFTYMQAKQSTFDYANGNYEAIVHSLHSIQYKVYFLNKKVFNKFSLDGGLQISAPILSVSRKSNIIVGLPRYASLYSGLCAEINYSINEHFTLGINSFYQRKLTKPQVDIKDFYSVGSHLKFYF